jgi:hypothetical protein
VELRKATLKISLIKGIHLDSKIATPSLSKIQMVKILQGQSQRRVWAKVIPQQAFQRKSKHIILKI